MSKWWAMFKAKAVSLSSIKMGLINTKSGKRPEPVHGSLVAITSLSSRAIEIVSPNVKPDKSTVIFARGAFPAVFTPEHVGIYVKNLIAFDLNKLENKDERIVIATFLEELVHCLLNIENEVEVGYKLAEIYPEVIFNGGRCIPRNNIIAREGS